MKIWGNFPIFGVYNKQKSIGKVDATIGVNGKKDVISISEQAKGFQTAIRALKDIPDIRQEKVNDLIGKFQAGNYNVNGRDIAEKIVKSTIDRTV